MSARRALLLGLLTVVVGLAAAPPAGAGGSSWYPDREAYAAGQEALLWAAVSWEHNPSLGTPQDGPFGVWLAPAPSPAAGFLRIPADAVYVGNLELDAIDRDVGPHVASIAFTVPDLPDGEYDVLHCNQPCTTYLGDILFGRLVIRADAGPGTATAPPATTPPSTTTMTTVASTSSIPASTTTDRAVQPLVADEDGPAPTRPALAIALAAAIGVGLAGLWLLCRPDPTTGSATSAAPGG